MRTDRPFSVNLTVDLIINPIEDRFSLALAYCDQGIATMAKQGRAQVKDSLQHHRHTTIIHLPQGDLEGTYDAEGKLYRFLGIPYAQPPIGKLRFRPPVAHQGWEGVFKADRFGEVSPQLFDPTEGDFHEFTDEAPVPGRKWVGSEDCLTLNIWTPEIDPSQPMPVMVWIHGGANWLEDSRLKCYHGDVLANRGNIVFVSIDYRLGPFGFLDVSTLGDTSYAGSHSNGLRDQLLAIHWVRQNIAHFGGNPDLVTLVGESAGSFDISWLLSTGALEGVVKRVSLMSGYGNPLGDNASIRDGLSDATAKRKARSFFAQCGVASLKQLQLSSTDDIMSKITDMSESMAELDMDNMFWPRTHESFARINPLDFAAQSPATHLDIMIGFTSYEMGLWLNWDDAIDQVSLVERVGEASLVPPRLHQEVIDLYRREFPDETEGVRGMYFMSDCQLVMPALWAAECLCETNTVWVYQFDRDTNDRRRAQHAADQVYFFGKLDTPVGKALAGIPDSDAEQRDMLGLAEKMQRIVIDFTRQEDLVSTLNWPKYTRQSRSLLNLGNRIECVNDPLKNRREWWFKAIYSTLCT